MKTYNKVIIIIGLVVLIALKCAGAGTAEEIERWAFDPRVNIYVVDKVEDEWRYNIYYCIDDRFIISLERDMWRNTGTITMSDDNGICYQTDWGDNNQSKIIINKLVRSALEASE